MLALQVWNGMEWNDCLFNYKPHEYEKMTEIMNMNNMHYVNMEKCMHG